MIRKITEAIHNNGENKTDYWFSDITANQLLNEAGEIQLNDQGILELCFPNAKLGISLKGLIYESDSERCSRVQLVYLEEDGEIYKTNKNIGNKEKECIIL